MTTWKVVETLFFNILNEIDNPDIMLINSVYWNELSDDKLCEDDYGVSDLDHIIAINYIKINAIEVKDTIWHEILHIIYPIAKHWWIECCAQRLSGIRIKGQYTKKYKHSVKDVPKKKKLIKNIKKRIKHY